MSWAWILFATVISTGGVPSYPAAQPSAPAVVTLDADGRRVVRELFVTRDSVERVRDFYLGAIGPQALEVDGVADGRHQVRFTGPRVGAPEVAIWRDAGDGVTHLEIARVLHRTSPEPSPAEAARRVLHPATGPFDVPLPEGAVADEIERVAGGRDVAAMQREVASFAISRPWGEVAAFYRAVMGGPALEGHEAGLDWLDVRSKRPDGPSVQVIQDPGSPVTRIVIHRRVLEPPHRR